MLVELTDLDGDPISFNPIQIVCIYPNAGDKVVKTIVTTPSDCWRIREEYVEVRQRWTDALGN